MLFSLTHSAVVPGTLLLRCFPTAWGQGLSCSCPTAPTMGWSSQGAYPESFPGRLLSLSVRSRSVVWRRGWGQGSLFLVISSLAGGSSSHGLRHCRGQLRSKRGTERRHHLQVSAYVTKTPPSPRPQQRVVLSSLGLLCPLHSQLAASPESQQWSFTPNGLRSSPLTASAPLPSGAGWVPCPGSYATPGPHCLLAPL